MEWVETTGKSVEEAVDAALDQLGVGEDDAEVEVLEEPKPGLFGRMRGEARVRVRVRPTQPRPKEDRRDRRRRRPGESSRTESTSEARDGDDDDGSGAGRRDEEKEPQVTEHIPLSTQATEAEEFLNGLVDRLGLAGKVSTEIQDEDNFQVRIDGDDLGVLIGPRGATLSALQELTRTVVQRRLNAHNGRLIVDVSGYRQKRKVALERFTKEVAD